MIDDTRIAGVPFALVIAALGVPFLLISRYVHGLQSMLEHSGNAWGLGDRPIIAGCGLEPALGEDGASRSHRAGGSGRDERGF